ncbi:MAG TPA: c-type cytochrome [Verrucomicrobiae bacterium]|nr:c-type cytochrome [Verrucomicrobiae bacterium]
MRQLLRAAAISCAAFLALAAGAMGAANPAPTASAGNAGAGAKLVAQFGCEGCHGAGLRGGGAAPSLFGIERRLSAAQLSEFIAHPQAPMPNFGLSGAQIADLVAYISGLDGGASGSLPVVSTMPSPPTSNATVIVRFPTPPHSATVTATMQMGSMTMHTKPIALEPTGDPHVYKAKIQFSMGGAWTLHVEYDGKHVDDPVTVGG